MISIVAAWIIANIFPLILTVVVTTIGALLAKVGIPSIFQGFILKVATNAVNTMEERAANYLKTTGNKMDSSVKLQGAMDMVKTYTGIDNAEANDIVHAALGAIPNVGASAKTITDAITGAIAK